MKRKKVKIKIMYNLRMGIKWAISKYQIKDNNEEITHYPMSALTLVAVIARIFYFVVIDAPETENSGWLAALIGAGFSLPSVAGAYLLMKKNGSSLENGVINALGNTGFRIFCLVLSLALMYETSALFTILTSSGAYATLYNMHKLLLLVPTSVAVIYACTKGGNGIGGAAEVWIRIYLVLYAIILFLEYDTMSVSNIFPILGPGLRGLMKNAFSITLYFSLIPVSFILESGYVVEGRNQRKKIKPESILFVFGLCVFLTVSALLVHSMMYPSLSPLFKSRSSGMDLMLSNGRSNRTVQLPILIVWFSSLALSCSYMLFCSGKLMNYALCERGRKCMLLLGLVSMVIALFRLSGQERSCMFSAAMGPVLSAAVFVICVIGIIRRKGGKE